MPGNTLFLTTVSIAAICCGASGAGAAERQRPVTHLRGAVHRVISALPGAQTLYDQNSDDTGVQVYSENFQPDYDDYDSYGADDFVVPVGHTWKIHEVDVTGAYGEGSTPAKSENIVFYRDSGGTPGTVVLECDDIAGADKGGSFALKLRKSCKVNLDGGARYWVSVVANESDDKGTIWGWDTRQIRNGKASMWENPFNGFGTGCTHWGS